MISESGPVSQHGTTGGVLLAGCVSLLALPSAVLAFSANFNVQQGPGPMNSMVSATTKESLARAIAMRSLAKSQAFPFTPAGTPRREDRAVTVAVRVDPEASQAIIVRGRIPPRVDAAQLRIAPTAFTLGASRGYQNFAQSLITQPAPKPIVELPPDLKKFSLSPTVKPKDNSRFSPRITLDEKRSLGRLPRTFSGDTNEVDLGGSYRVTDNLDVTAGVRYSQDRERLVPLTDGKLDGQAVYVGTQFKF